MNRFKKYVLSAIIFILTICSTSFAYNQVSWNDFSDWVNENLEIDISNYTNCGMANSATWESFKSFFNNSNGFYIYENNNGIAKNITYDGRIFFVFCKDEMPTQKIRVEDQSYHFYSSDIPTNTRIYIFNKETKNFVGESSFTSKNYGWFKWTMSSGDSVINFYSEENSKYVLHNQVLCASNYNFLVQNLLTNYEWAYGLTVTEMLKTPFPWEEIGTGGGDSNIYDFKFENFKQKYFQPFIKFNAAINGYVDYTGNWDKGTTWEINNTTYRDNDFYLYVYSGDGTVDSNIYNGYIYLDIFKANHITSGDINYTYYDSKKCSPEQVFINAEEISENIMKYRFTLKRCFNDEEEINHDYNTGWLNDFSTSEEYIFRLRFENAGFETTSKTSWFYFNLQSPLSLYRNTSQYNIPQEYINADETFENYYIEKSQLSDVWNAGLESLGLKTFGGSGEANFENIIESSKAFLNNFLGFFNIFPPWFNTLIALALTVAIICRIIGR